MSGLRSIGINFTGKDSGLEQASEKAARGLGDVATHAENLDDKGSKATDSLGALSSGFELVGLEQYSAGLQSAALATDFMSGVGTGLNLIMELQSVQFIKAKLASVAHTVAQTAAAAAAKAVAAAQWLLNAAMSANPIGLVVIAIVALIAIFVLAWKNSATFRAVVTGALNGILAVASAVAKWFTGKFAPWISGVFQTVTNAISGALGWVRKNWPLILAILTGPIGLAVLAISKNWDSIVGTIKGLPKRIASAASGMWDGITSAFRSAINWIISKWNSLEFKIPGVDTHIPGVGTVGGFSLGTPNIPMLAAGGTLVRSGLVGVGERGPELLDLPGGASVVPLDQAGGDVAVYVTIDGEQLQGRIDKTVRTNNRELKRTVKAA